MDPYKEAQPVEALLNKLAETQPPSKDNKREWTLFIRTVKSSLLILEEVIDGL